LRHEEATIWSVHHHILSREATDVSVVAEEARIPRQRLGGRLEVVSSENGFRSPESLVELARIISHPCAPQRGGEASRRANGLIEDSIPRDNPRLGLRLRARRTSWVATYS
jgi:hypothetical protein